MNFNPAQTLGAGPFWQRRWLKAKAVSEVIPPHGACVAQGITYDTDTGEIIYNVVLPNRDGWKASHNYAMHPVFFNSHMAIDNDEYGSVTIDFPCVAATDVVTPAAGQVFGVQGGDHELTQWSPGYLVVGKVKDSHALIVPHMYSNETFYALTPSGGLPAAVSNAPGSASNVTMYYLDGAATLTTTSKTITLYNFGGAVEESTYVKISRDVTGTWSVDVEPC